MIGCNGSNGRKLAVPDVTGTTDAHGCSSGLTDMIRCNRCDGHDYKCNGCNGHVHVGVNGVA